MAEFIVINGHAPWCAYLASLHDLDGEEPCDCRGWNDDENDGWAEDLYDDDHGWWP